ncbi:hypothetical protein Tco_1200029 [Tanacetum coccineum]
MNRLECIEECEESMQTTREVHVGQKLGFKPTKQVYQPVSKNGANTSGKKKQVGLTRQEVSNSNPFDVINLVKNDDDLDSDGEVEEVFNETKETTVDDDYDTYDDDDDDVYEGYDIPENLQAICDYWDIKKFDVGNFELLLLVLLYYCWFKIDTATED